jgi:two-component system, OmpR family, KDP operon response regulator KdpE
MSLKQNILVIDDEIQIRRLLKIGLESSGFTIIEAKDGSDGISKAASFRPDLIILDLGLPDEDGLEVLKKLRDWMKIPIVILSVRNSEKDIITALDLGADDYLTKPFNTGELLARIRVALRHSQPEQSTPVYKNGPIEVDFTARIVKKKGIQIKLTATEFNLLALFIRNAGKVITHRYILKEIWGQVFSEETQYVRIYIAQLRKKLEDDPNHPKLFVTESGVGYRLNIYS